MTQVCSPSGSIQRMNDPKPDSADLKVRDLCELHQLWQRREAKPLIDSTHRA